MSADNEGDSQMLSSPEGSESESQQRATITRNNKPSPTSSQSRAMPTSASGASIANSNGKRPIQTISNGNDDAEAEELAAMANGKARQEYPLQTHEPSGYIWAKPEDAPGFAWLNRKAVDEYHRAWETLAHRDYWTQNKLSGDFMEICEREQATIISRFER